MIPAWVAPFVEIPFHDFGRTRDGADCWGLARMIWKERAGIELPDFPVNPNRGDLVVDAMAEELPNWVAVAPGDERELDGVRMNGCYGTGRQMKRAAMHIGVVVAPGWVIHTTAEAGYSCLGRYREWPMCNDVTGFWRHRALA